MITVDEHTPQIFEPDYYAGLHALEERHWWAMGMRDAMRALLRNALANRHHLRTLDLGCGTGYLLNDLKRYPLASDPVGLDLSAHALAWCHERGASALVQASATETPFAAESFDLIICIDTLQHLSPSGAEAALAECARLLRPGGALYLRTNSALGHAPISGVDAEQYRRYRIETVAGMLRAAGLDVERATYLNALPAAWAMLREYARRRQQVAAPIGPGLSIRLYPRRLEWLNRLLHAELAIEAWLIGTLGINLPFGHSSAYVARRPARGKAEHAWRSAKRLSRASTLTPALSQREREPQSPRPLGEG